MISFMGNMLRGIRRQIAVVVAIAAYDINRKSTGSSIGSWRPLLGRCNPAVFILMRVDSAFER